MKNLHKTAADIAVDKYGRSVRFKASPVDIKYIRKYVAQIESNPEVQAGIEMVLQEIESCVIVPEKAV